MSFGKRPWRFWLMQTALCGVLALTLALAAWLTHARRQRLRVEFGGSETAAGMHVPHPARWAVQQLPDGIVFEEGETDGMPGRTVQVRRVRFGGLMSPLELLALYEEVRPSELAAIRAGGESELTVDGWRGVLISQQAVGMVNRNQALARKHLVGCAVLPSGDGVVLVLDGLGMAQEADRDLVKRLARGIEVEGVAPPRAGGEVDLLEGIHANLPAGVEAPAQRDKFRADVTVVSSAAPGWLGGELVSCYFPPGYGPAELEAMLRARDTRFVPGQVRRDGADTLVCTRQGDAFFPGVAYLKRVAKDRAVLAEFRWTPEVSPAAVDALWKSIASSIEAQEAEPLEKLVGRGEQAIKSRPADARELLAREIPQEIWQGYQESTTQDWITHETYQVGAAEIRADTQIGRWPSTRPIAQPPGEANDAHQSPMLVQIASSSTWVLARDWSAYEALTTRAAGGGLVTRRTILRNGRITMSMNGVAQSGTSQQVRPNFVPGGALPLLMGRLSPEQGKLALQTDSLPGPAQVATTMPMLLILEPAFDVPRYYGNQEEPMRCWAVRLNGSEQISRWYFDESGRLQVISFAGGFHLQRVEAP